MLNSHTQTTSQQRVLLSLGFLSVATGIALGAFAAHAIQDEDSKKWLGTAGLYTMIHGLGILALALLARLETLMSFSENQPLLEHNLRWIPSCQKSFLLGMVFFSGSLTVLALTHERGWGAVTPLGGALWIFTWIKAAWKTWTTWGV